METITDPADINTDDGERKGSGHLLDGVSVVADETTTQELGAESLANEIRIQYTQTGSDTGPLTFRII